MTHPVSQPSTTYPARMRLRALADCEPDGPATCRGSRPPEVAGGPPAAEAPVAVTPPGPTQAELRRLVGAVLEVLEGRRPVTQLKRYLGATCYEALRTRAAAEARRRRSHRLCRLHVSRPAARSIELCATVEVGDRMLAAAASVEIARHGWCCTTLRFL